MSLVSKKGIYAVDAMCLLATLGKNNMITSKEIALQKNISHNFLEQILILLKKDNLIKSIRGNKGGYQLAKSCEDITVLDILNSIETCFACVQNDEEQLSYQFWEDSKKKIQAIFDISLYDLIKNNQKNIIFSI